MLADGRWCAAYRINSALIPLLFLLLISRALFQYSALVKFGACALPRMDGHRPLMQLVKVYLVLICICLFFGLIIALAWASIQLRICVVPDQGLFGGFGHIGEVIIEQLLLLIGLVYLLFQFEQVLLQLVVGPCFLVLFGCLFVDADEGVVVLGANSIDHPAEVTLEVSELFLYALLENLCVNDGVIEIELCHTLLRLEFLGDGLVICGEANANLVVSQLLETETKVPLEVLDDLVCAVLRLVHALKQFS